MSKDKIAKLEKPLASKIIGHGEEKVEDLLANPLNFRIHPDHQQRALAGSIDDIGFIRSVTVNQRTGRVVDGHLRVHLALRSGVETLPVEYVDLDEQEEALALLSLDPIAAMAASDREKLSELMGLIESEDERIKEMIETIQAREGVSMDDHNNGGGSDSGAARKTLAERFGIPPFSVLDARKGYWQKRKNAWINLGIKSELGRGSNGGLNSPGNSPLPAAQTKDGHTVRGDGRGRPLAETFGSGKPGTLAAQYKEKQKNYVEGVLMKSDSGNDPAYYFKKQQVEKMLGRQISTEEFQEKYYTGPDTYESGTSIFDPVLTELIYRWFTPGPAAEILDPFCGGSVRGIVAGVLGHHYTGVDLREEQVQANQEQAATILTDTNIKNNKSTKWKISSKWASQQLNCTHEGIINNCHGNCCNTPGFWPPKAGEKSGQNDHACYYLGEKGCTLSDEDKPVTCHLFPMKLNKNNTLIGWHRMKQPGSVCYPNTTSGPMIIEAIFESLVHLLGREKADYILSEVQAGRDPIVEIPEDVIQALNNEYIWESNNEIPKPRSQAVQVQAVQLDTILNSPTIREEGVFLDDPLELTPVQKIGDYYFKRDDFFSVLGVRGGKVRTCLKLALSAKDGLITAGSRHSPQVNIVAHVAKKLGLGCRIHTPTGALSPEVQMAVDLGADIVQHKAGYNNVIVARAREDAAESGWTNIPFGMECSEAVELTRNQVRNLPREISRIVLPVGSGMTLAGVLWGMKDCSLNVPVLGVIVGANPEERLDKYAPKDWRDLVTLVKSDLDYSDNAPSNIFNGLLLDPIYEAKCIPFLKPGDLFWIVGIRKTARPVQTIQAATVDTIKPNWIVGDSQNIQDLAPGEYDLIFSCPPYGDLEVYSDDPQDLSTMEFEDFIAAYKRIIQGSINMLKDNRFACFIVGDFRDKQGFYRNFPAITIEAFQEAGAVLYNEAILVTAIGSLALRVGKQFAGYRKLGKTHQNVLIFFKGDPKTIKEFGEVEVGEIDDIQDITD